MLNLHKTKILAGVLLFSACGESDVDPRIATDDDDMTLRYGSMCASCHGHEGEGGVGPSLIRTIWDRESLTQKIDLTMPTEDPSDCTDVCAELIANYVADSFTTAPN